MSFELIPRLRGLGTVRKVLLAGTAATAAALIGTGVAHAATPSPLPPASSTSQSPETTGGPDTDNVQSGDQTGSDTAVDKPTSGDTVEKTAGRDTDNVQSGDQTGSDTDNVQSGDQTGADTAN